MFTGTVVEIIEEFVMPNLPPADCLLAWTDSLLRHAVEDPDPIHISVWARQGSLKAAS
jgi:hypothetical protein